MKKIFSVVITVIFFVHTTYAQKQTLLSHPYQPRFEKGTIKYFLDDISRSTGIIIEYASNTIDTGKIISAGSSPSVVENILKQVLKGQKVNIVEKNNKIILSPSGMPLADDSQHSLYSFYGFIKDASSKEPLSDASILELSQYGGTRSNNYGYFTLQVPGGKRVVSVSYTGYREQKIDLDLRDDRRLDIELVPKSAMEEAMIVSGVQKQAGAGNLVVDAKATNMMLGEPDIVRSIDLLPGVSSIPEISNGMLVRGGSPDQNVLLLEGNPIFNPTHLLGTVSIINKTSLKSFYLHKSSFPARFGGALSSVMDVSTKDGNMQQWKGEANAGLLAGSVTIEGPLKKDRTAIMLSFRNSWINPFLRVTKAGFDVNFYDAHFKCTQLISSKDKLMLNVYAGHDKLNLLKDNINNQQRWGNKAASLAWNRLLAPRAFVNSSVNVSNYENTGGFRYAISDSTGVNSSNRVYNTFSSIRQYAIRTEAEIYSSNTVRYNFGAKMSFTRIRPFNTNVTSDFIDNPENFRAFPTLYYKEVVLFYENELRINRLFLRPGIHVSHYRYGKFRYNSLQPRFYAGYTLNAFHQLSFSYNHMTQNLHLVTNPYLGINSDAWVPSTSVLSPEESDMINAGYLFTGRKKLSLGAELYYKKMKNVTNYIDGKNLFLNNADWEQYVQSGKGWSYGLEIKAAKKTAKWQTQLSYTLSWNQRQFKAVNNGARFPFKYDRRHMLNIAATYVRNNHWDFSALWSFATGDVYTLPDKIYSDFDVAQQIIDPLAPREYRLIYHSSAVNQYRTLPYHRMDISSGYHHRITGNIRPVFTAGIYNVYGSPSQYVYDLEGTVGKKSLIVTSRYKFFGITPYLSCSITF